MFKCTCMITDARLYLWIPQIWPIHLFILILSQRSWPAQGHYYTVLAKYTPTLLGKLVSLPDLNLKGHMYR